MPAPLAPIAIKVAQYGAVATIAWWAARRRRPDGPRDLWRERVLDDLDEGLETDFAQRDGETRAGASGRWRRVIRAGGAGMEVEIAGLTRFRVRRVE